MHNILVSSAGRRVSLVRHFQAAAHERGRLVVATDMSPLAPALTTADLGVVVPPISDATFVDAMESLVEEHQIGLMIPTLDTELPTLAKNRDRFTQLGCHIAIGPAPAVDICADKVLTHQWLTEQGFPTVRQTSPSAALASPQDWPMPLIAKPAKGSASHGVRIVRSLDELVTCAETDIVQSIATGDELTVDVYIDRSGSARVAVPRQRLETRAGEVSKAVTVRHQGAQRLASEIVERLGGMRGAANVQMFADGDGLEVIEINPRFGGGFPLSHRAGAHFPEWMLDEDNELSIEPGDWAEGVYMLRYDDAVFVDCVDLP